MLAPINSQLNFYYSGVCPIIPLHTHTYIHKHINVCIHIHSTHTNKRSLVDYYVLSHEIQVIAFFLPEAPIEMFKIFDEVSFRSFTAF